MHLVLPPALLKHLQRSFWSYAGISVAPRWAPNGRHLSSIMTSPASHSNEEAAYDLSPSLSTAARTMNSLLTVSISLDSLCGCSLSSATRGRCRKYPSLAFWIVANPADRMASQIYQFLLCTSAASHIWIHHQTLKRWTLGAANCLYTSYADAMIALHIAVASSLASSNLLLVPTRFNHIIQGTIVPRPGTVIVLSPLVLW